MKIGIITFKKYEENVLLDSYFNIDDLFKIITQDIDFVSFQIFDKQRDKQQLLLSTIASEAHKIKVHWTVNGGICKTRKEATAYADRINRQAKQEIKKYITTH